MTRGTDAASWYTGCSTKLRETLATHRPLVNRITSPSVRKTARKKARKTTRRVFDVPTLSICLPLRTD
jgi:hypothetical protein